MNLVHYFKKAEPHMFDPSQLTGDMTYLRGGLANKPNNVFWLSEVGGKNTWEDLQKEDPKLFELWDMEQPMHFKTTSSAQLLKIDSLSDVPEEFLTKKGYRQNPYTDNKDTYTIIDWDAIKRAGYSGAIVSGTANLEPMDVNRNKGINNAIDVMEKTWEVDSVVIWDPKAIEIS